MNTYYSDIPRVLFTQKEIAAMFGVALATVRRWQRLGCPFVRVGAMTVNRGCRTRLDVEDVKSWLKSRSAAACAAAVAKAAAPPAPVGAVGATPAPAAAPVAAVAAKVPAPAPASEPAGVMGAPAAAAPAAGVDSVIQYLAGRVEITLTGLALHECAAAFMAEMEGCGWCGSDGRPVVDWKPMARAFALRWMKGGAA